MCNCNLIGTIFAFNFTVLKDTICLKSDGKTKVTDDNVLKKMKQESSHFTNNVLRQKIANAGHNLRVPSGSYAMLLLKQKFEEKKKKQEKGIEEHKLMICCDGQRKTNFMK